MRLILVVWRWGVALSFLSLFLFSVGDNVRGPLYPDVLSAFGLHQAEGSLFFLAASVTAVILQFLTPRILEAFPHHFYRVLNLGLFCLGLSSLGYFFAVEVQSFLLLILSSVVFGVGMGFVSVYHGILLQNSIPAERHSSAFSNLHAFYGLGAMLSPLLVTSLRPLLPSWQSCFLVVTGLSVVVLGLSLLKHKSLPLIVTRIGADSASGHERLPQVSSETRTIDQKLLTSDWMLIASLTLLVTSEILISSRLPLFLREVHAATASQAETALMVFFFGLLAGRIVGGKVVKRIAFLKLGPLLIGSTLALFAIGVFVSPVALSLAGFSLGPLFPLTLSHCSSVRPKIFQRFSALAYAWVGVGIVSMHAIFGFLSDAFGLTLAMGSLLVYALLALMLFPRKI